MKILLLIPLLFLLPSCQTQEQKEAAEHVKILNYQSNLTGEDLLEFVKNNPQIYKE